MSFYHDVTDPTSLYECLSGILRETSRDSLPILHFEVHGSDKCDGLYLKNNEFISWNDLKKPLTAINIASGNNLMITMAICNGAHIARVLNPTERAICWGFFGPLKPVPSLAAISFRPFYSTLLSSSNGDEAMKAFNEDLANESIQFKFMPSILFFKLVLCAYNDNFIKAKQRKEHVRYLYDQVKASGLRKIPTYGDIKKMLKRFDRPIFEKFKNRFFMIDLYPENRDRFNIKYEDVLSKPQ